MAKKYKLPFPLIEDKELALSKSYVGVDDDGYAVPGVVVVKPGGEIGFRQIGADPGDRVYAADLLAVVERMTGGDVAAKAEGADFRGGYAPLERLQLRLGARLGLAQQTSPGDGFGFSLGGEVAGLYPIGRYIMVGAMARGLAIESTSIDTSALVRVRRPILYDLGELYLQVPIGLSIDATNDEQDTNEQLGLNSGAHVGIQFAVFPNLAMYLEAAASYHSFAGRDGADGRVELRYSAGGGVGFLF